jgi:hypothetical protein
VGKFVLVQLGSWESVLLPRGLSLSRSSNALAVSGSRSDKMTTIGYRKLAKNPYKGFGKLALMLGSRLVSTTSLPMGTPSGISLCSKKTDGVYLNI